MVHFEDWWNPIHLEWHTEYIELQMWELWSQTAKLFVIYKLEKALHQKSRKGYHMV